MIKFLPRGKNAYAVVMDDQEIGRVTRYYPTLERRTPGKTYVNARWTARTPSWEATSTNGKSSRGHSTRRVASIWLMSQRDQ